MVGLYGVLLVGIGSQIVLITAVSLDAASKRWIISALGKYSPLYRLIWKSIDNVVLHYGIFGKMI